VGFLRRLFGGDGEAPSTPSARPTQEELDAEERAHELELARFEQDRTTDLVRRQQRYSDQRWTPPAQGGTIRAGEADEGGEERGGEERGGEPGGDAGAA
jgi:hypothetical protein